MPLLAEYIPENNRHGLWRERESKLFGAFDHILVIAARLADAGEVSFDVRHENGYANATKALGHGLQGDGLASSRGARDQTMPIRHFGYYGKVLRPLRNQNFFRHPALPFRSIVKESGEGTQGSSADSAAFLWRSPRFRLLVKTRKILNRRERREKPRRALSGVLETSVQIPASSEGERGGKARVLSGLCGFSLAVSAVQAFA